jgi:uncharacterized protein (TIGR03086 family)
MPVSILDDDAATARRRGYEAVALTCDRSPLLERSATAVVNPERLRTPHGGVKTGMDTRGAPASSVSTMSDASQHYGAVAAGFTARVENVAADQWSTNTPCTEWTVQDLVAHVVGTHRKVIATLDGSEAAEVNLGDDLFGQWLTESGTVTAALRDPTRASKIVSGMFGEQPFESLVTRLLCADTLMHTWDLARATGQGERLDPVAVANAMTFLAPIDEAIRRPGGFAAKITPAPDADEQRKLLNFCGRAA